MRVRSATAQDDAGLARLFSSYHDEYRHELGDQDVAGEGRQARRLYEAVLVAVADAPGGGEGDELLGCVAYQAWGEGRARMKRMYVPPAHRGRGIGRELAQAIMERARSDGYRLMVLDTTGPMKAATALYRSLGFSGFEPDYEAPCRDTVYLAREL